MTLTRSVVSTERGPAAIGPYSQAIRAGGFIFVSGQTPLDPKTMKIVEGGIEAQTERAIRNVAAILEAGGSGLPLVVRSVVYLTTMTHFVPMNEVYQRFFKSEKPARTTIAVSELPLGALVEIECTALDPATAPRAA